jgi:hypothetical protein
MLLSFLFGTLVVPRTHQIIRMLQNYHRRDFSKDKEMIQFVMGMVLVSQLSNEEIVKEVLEVDAIKKKELAS